MSDVKAGKYEVAALFWEEPTSKVGEPYDYVRHNRGDIVTLNVEEARRLVQAGAVVEPGARERAAAEAARLQYEMALAALPDTVRAQLLGQDDPPMDEDQPPNSPPAPQRVAARGAWVKYAIARGVPEAEAEGLSKDQLVERFLTAD